MRQIKGFPRAAQVRAYIGRYLWALDFLSQYSPPPRFTTCLCRVSTEVTFGRGDLSVCPIGGSIGARNILLLTGEECPPGVPTGTNTKGTSP